MTRKDYREMVETLVRALNTTVYLGIPIEHVRATLTQVAVRFCYKAKRDNAQFDSVRFMDAVKKVGI